MPLGIAIKTAFTAKALPLAKDRQGYYLTACEGCMRARVRLRRQRGLAKIVHYDIKSSQEGVWGDHRAAPYLREDRAILQVEDTFRSIVSGQLTPSV
jgi:hypothetical protein